MELDGSNYKWNPNGAMAHILVLSLSKEKDSSKIFDFYYSIKSFNKSGREPTNMHECAFVRARAYSERDQTEDFMLMIKGKSFIFV